MNAVVCCDFSSYLAELFLILRHLLQHLREFLHGGLKDNETPAVNKMSSFIGSLGMKDSFNNNISYKWCYTTKTINQMLLLFCSPLTEQCFEYIYLLFTLIRTRIMFLFTYMTYYLHLHLNVFHKEIQSLSYPKYQYLIDCNINI